MGEKPDLAAYCAQRYPLTFVDTCQADEHLSSRYDEAWRVAKEAAAPLKKAYGAKKVIVFGSLVHRSSFARWSDIDLAAWDIPDDRFYAAVGAVTGLSPEFKVDLVDPTVCRESLRRAVDSEGIDV